MGLNLSSCAKIRQELRKRQEINFGPNSITKFDRLPLKVLTLLIETSQFIFTFVSSGLFIETVNT